MSVIGIIGKSTCSAKEINGETGVGVVVSARYRGKKELEGRPLCNALHFWKDESDGLEAFLASRQAVHLHTCLRES
jgi:hypothetical protein